LIARRDDDVGAGGAQRSCDLQTDTGTAPGDDRGLAVQIDAMDDLASRCGEPETGANRDLGSGHKNLLLDWHGRMFRKASSNALAAARSKRSETAARVSGNANGRPGDGGDIPQAGRVAMVRLGDEKSKFCHRYRANADASGVIAR